MKKISILMFCLFLISCSSYKSLIYGSNKEIIERLDKTYNQLDKRYYELLDDEIQESERKKLETDYKNFYSDLNKSKMERKIDVSNYMNKTKIKIDYLIDLK